MEKLYERINFENSPSVKTPLSEENLNKMDSAINELDNRTVEFSNKFTDLETDLGTVYSGYATRGTVLFTSDDVAEGDEIHYDFTAPSESVGYLRFYDAAGNRLDLFGKTSVTSTETHYAGVRIIPAKFSYCDAYAASEYMVYVKYLTHNHIKHRVDKLEKDVEVLFGHDENIQNMISAMKTESRNIFDTEFVDGRVNTTTGEVYIPSTITGYAVTKEMIAVEPNTEYTATYIEGEEVGTWSCWEYDENKTFVVKSVNSHIRPLTFTTGENTHFIILQIADSAYTAQQLIPKFTQVEKGGKATMPVANTTIQSDLIDAEELYKSLIKAGVIKDRFVVPSYYHDNQYLDNKVDKINEYMGSAVANGDAFIFITDEHWEDNAKQSPALIRYLYDNCNINKLFSGGDVYCGNNADWTPAMDFTRTLRHAFKGNIYHICGNHDLFKKMPSSRLSMMFDMYNDDYNGNPEKHYYYVDNKRAKIRYIILNSYYESETDNAVNGFPVDAEQQEWFRNSLNVDEGWGIIIFNHHTWFNNVENPTILDFDSRFRVPFLDVIDNYDGEGEIICFIQGHTHIDKVLQTPGGIPVIITTCDKNRSIETPDDVYPTNRETGTIREQAFDVFVVDRKNRKINIVRIGCPALNSTSADVYGEEVEERIVTY